MKNTTRMIAITAALCLTLSACGTTSGEQNEEKQTNAVTKAAESSEKAESIIQTENETRSDENTEKDSVHLDYGDEEAFEAALNSGDDLNGKTVSIIAQELHPESIYGYNIWAGIHLNFVSPDDPNVQVGDVLTVRITNAELVDQSWIISYEMVENAVEDEYTITSENLPKTNEEPEEDTPNAYESNKYYEIIDAASWINSIGNTVIVHKIQAKQDVSISASLIAYSEDGSVVGKGSDDITLTKGQVNYFEYHFSGDISGAKLRANATAKSDGLFTGARNAVELVQCDIAGEEVFLTFKQTADELGGFAKFKLLLYKDDQIVGTKDGHFEVYAKNLNGKGATDMADITVYETDFDRVEVIIEP